MRMDSRRRLRVLHPLLIGLLGEVGRVEVVGGVGAEVVATGGIGGVGRCGVLYCRVVNTNSILEPCNYREVPRFCMISDYVQPSREDE